MKTNKKNKPEADIFPETLLRRTPLINRAGFKMIQRLKEHADSPKFNHETGDRLTLADLRAVDGYRDELRAGRVAVNKYPPEEILARVSSLRGKVAWFRANIPNGLNLNRDWETAGTSSRKDIAVKPWEFVPDDMPLDRLIIYRTAGTTGHPISVPHHPVAIAFYLPLVECALQRYGVKFNADSKSVACFLVGAQIHTYTYATVLSAWGGAGFAKLNIRQTEWHHDGSQTRYFANMEPRLLNGDPISFSEMMRMKLPAKPVALITTSVSLSPALKQRLQKTYGAPVIDWYSLVETGPIGYGCPKGNAYHILPHDIYVEAIDGNGIRVPDGARGEIAVTGGRNPFCPLLRYRTGDWGRLDFTPCSCGDSMPRIMELEGRVPVLFRSSDGTPVSTVDISRLLREFPLLLHEFTQHTDFSCELVLRGLPDGPKPDVASIEKAMRHFLGSVPLEIRVDPKLGDRLEGKAMPYRSGFLLED